MISVDEAIEHLLRQARPIEAIESVPTADALGRVLAEPVISAAAVPPLDNSEMDGFAVHCADVAAVPAVLPVTQRIQAGQIGQPLAPGCAARIFTGAPVPAGCDAVVPQEDTRAQGDRVVVLQPAARGQYIRRAGLDIAPGSAVLARGALLKAPQLGLAASVGLAQLNVVRRVRVAVFFTGDELVMPGQPLPPGRIYNSNRPVALAALRSLGCEAIDLGIVPDDLQATRQALVRAAEGADLVMTCGGASVGEADYVRSAVQAEGSIDLWQVAIKPGKPLAFGRVRGIAFIGLPGNPVSAFVALAILARPFIRAMQGARVVRPQALPLRTAFELPKPGPRREFLRVRVNPSGMLEAHPVQNSAVLTSVAWCDGLADIAAGLPVRRGTEVPFIALSELFG